MRPRLALASLLATKLHDGGSRALQQTLLGSIPRASHCSRAVSIPRARCIMGTASFARKACSRPRCTSESGQLGKADLVWTAPSGPRTPTSRGTVKMMGPSTKMVRDMDPYTKSQRLGLPRTWPLRGRGGAMPEPPPSPSQPPPSPSPTLRSPHLDRSGFCDIHLGKNSKGSPLYSSKVAFSKPASSRRGCNSPFLNLMQASAAPPKNLPLMKHCGKVCVSGGANKYRVHVA